MADLESETAASSINRRGSGIEWIYNLTPEGNNLNRLSINVVINVSLLLFKKAYKLLLFQSTILMVQRYFSI